MPNTFDSCRLKLKEEYKNVKFFGSMDLQELTLKTEEIFKKESTVSKKKSQAIVFLLNNAGVQIPNDESIFAYKINHNDIMQKFLDKNKATVMSGETKEKVRGLEETNAIRADMDFGHIAPDWNYLLSKGVLGVAEDLEELKSKNSQKEYYDERIAVYKAMAHCFERFALAASQLKTEKGDFVAQNFRQLSVSAPKTFPEALQFILSYYRFQMDLDTVILRSLGGLDRMLYPFYKADLESGRYTKEQLTEFLRYFLFEISCMDVIANLPFYICGMDEEGNDATNELTFLILETYRELDIYDPKIHVMYHEKINERVVDIVLTMIREGKNSFVFMNTPLASRALEKIGISKEDAKKVIVYGCYETAAEGTEVPCTCGGMVNLAKAVELAVHNGKDALSGRQISIKTGEKFNTFEDFLKAVLTQVKHYTVACMDTIAAYEPNYKNVCPSLMMSPTYKTSRETGVDVYQGGAKYNNTSIVGAGLATLTDSLVAIKHIVFEEKLVCFEEFKEILLSDWQKDLRLQLKAKNKYAKFGNNNCEADTIAKRVYETYAKVINGRKNGRGGVFKCGMFSVDWRYWMGETTAATPDGRCSCEPLSKNLAASIGQDKNGVTAYLNSLLKLDALECSDGYVADVVLHHSAVKDEEGMSAFKALLLTFMEKGGFSVHFNVLNPTSLVNAQKEPEKYKNLQIRLCGWNVRFIDLEKHQQDEFIKQSSNVM